MNTPAVNGYVKRLAQAEKSLKRLSEYIEDHGEVSPDDVTWAHVGSVSHLASELNMLVNFIDNAEES